MGSHKSVKIRTLTGVSCPSVQPHQMVEAEKIAGTLFVMLVLSFVRFTLVFCHQGLIFNAILAMETGPNEDQMIENAGRSAAMMALQALGKCSKKFPARV